MQRILGVTLFLATLLWTVSPALAWSPTLAVDEDTWIQLGFLHQLHYESVEDAAGTNNNKWSSEFFTRRARILGNGSVHENVKFFFNTDIPNAGKTGSSNSIVLNDAIIDLQIAPEIKIALGRILPPFSIESQASAATLLAIDYNVNTIKLPTPNDRSVWRDDGIEIRGIVLEGLLDYRVGVFRGERSGVTRDIAGNIVTTGLNPDHDGRFTGMLMVNLAEPQPGWFYNMNGLGTINTLSVGFGYDRIGNSHASDGKAWSVFALADQPMGMGRITGAAAWYDWDGRGWAGDFEGTTASVQVGYLMPAQVLPGQWQPVVRYQRQNPDNAGTLNTFNIGVNYYLKGHMINFKADYAINDQRIEGSRKDAVRFQTQLFF